MRALRHAVPLLVLTTLLVALAFAGCASTSSSTDAVIGSAGGSLSLQGVRLEVPAGALTQDTHVVLSSTSSPGALLVGMEPADLDLARTATLSVQLQGRVHVFDVSELRGTASFPVGVDSRVETASGAQLRMRLDHFAQVRMMMMDGGSDGGAKTCCGDDCGEGEHHDGGDDHLGDGGHKDDGEHGDDKGGHGDGGVCDGGTDDHGDHQRDGGVISSSACPAGFECDDGVCVAPGGNDEENDDEGCGEDDSDEHHDKDAGPSASCPVGAHCADGHCMPDQPADGGVH